MNDTPSVNSSEEIASHTGVGSEAHLRSILATVPDAVVVIDEHGLILSFSTAAEKMFGYLEEEVVGRNVSLLMPAPDQERHDGYLKNYRRTGERKIIGIGRVTSARHRDGHTFPIELSVGEALVAGRRIFSGFIHDITDRQRAENRLRSLQAELAHVGRISEMASLASALAHELNQPLTAVANYCEAARDLLGTSNEHEQELLREALDAAAQETLRAGKIVQRLRSFVRPGDTEFRSESLGRLVTEANALALVGSREQGVSVAIHLDPAADEVWIDRIQIQQVLTNLIRNAIDAMANQPRRTLTISSQRRLPGFVTVSVEDTGCGIDRSLAPELFRPFVTSKTNGMGVGLSICRTIVEAHGGQISFAPAQTGGTVFEFNLPLMEKGE